MPVERILAPIFETFGLIVLLLFLALGVFQ